MPRSRFQLLSVEHRGYPVARIFDSVRQEELKIYRRGSRFLHWNRRDAKVVNRALQRVAREALA